MQPRFACLTILCFTLGFSVKAYSVDCFGEDKFSQLDYGLYWFGANQDCEKAEPNVNNPYYDPSKPTVLLIHGWQSGNINNDRRIGFDASAVGAPDVDLARAWLDRGWNIGRLYWDQFADEGEVKDAEAKIWSTNGRRKMRWLDSRGEFNDFAGNQSVGDLLTEVVISNMQDFNGPELRLTGHSLGSQLALLIAGNLHQNASNSSLKPRRVALLDFFFSKGRKNYLNNKWTGEVGREIADRLIAESVVIETYRTSLTGGSGLVGDNNNGLIKKSAFIEVRPWYFGGLDIGKKHTAAWWHYLWSFDFAPPAIDDSSDQGLSASTSYQRSLELMTGSRSLLHIGGRYTKSPEDDLLRYKRK